jgi:cob(I)alamin adenosyltransferase
MSRTGKIQVFTGEGKGKTTAAVGAAVLAIGTGRKVLMIQFLKSPNSSGEQMAALALDGQFTIKPMGRKGFIYKRNCESLDHAMAESALEEARFQMVNGDYDVVILDEINVAVHLGLIQVGELLELIDLKPEKLELILTGRYAHPAVAGRADSVIEMKKIKHHFDSGVPAREGIEF